MDYDNKFYQYVDFLDTKYELDKKSMSAETWNALLCICAERSSDDRKWPARILDCGCGTGAMLRHLLDHQIHIGEYHGIDIHPGLLAEARKHAAEGRFGASAQTLEFHALSVYNLYRAASATDIATSKAFEKQFDLVCALSLAEHVEIDRMLTNIRNVLKEDGILFLPINYGGGTVFEPTFDYVIENAMIDVFNSSSISGQVYEGQVGGDAFCGRTLYDSLRRNGFEVLAFCPEDWLIVPEATYPHYPTDIRNFLATVINEVAKANIDRISSAHPSMSHLESGILTKTTISEWQDMRQGQIKEGQLSFRCHQSGAIAKKKESKTVIQSLEIGVDGNE